MVVSELNKEGYATQKEKIDAKIAGINSYMEQNKAKMEALENVNKVILILQFSNKS